MHRIVLPDLVRLLARVGTRRIGDPAVPVVLAEAGIERGVAVRDGALRAQLAANGIARARLFTWKRCAEAARQAYLDARW